MSLIFIYVTVECIDFTMMYVFIAMSKNTFSSKKKFSNLINFDGDF